MNVKILVGVKEASGDISQIMKIIKGKPENFNVISGDDMMTLPVIAAGGSGVISVLANAFPAQCSELVQHLLKVILNLPAKYSFGSLRLLNCFLLKAIHRVLKQCLI